MYYRYHIVVEEMTECEQSTTNIHLLVKMNLFIQIDYRELKLRNSSDSFNSLMCGQQLSKGFF